METFYFNKEKKAFFLPTKEISFQKFFEEQKNKLNINEIENDDLENTELGNNIIINNINIYISNNSKLIDFVDFDKTYKIFICNREQVLFLINELGFYKFKIYKKNKKLSHIPNSLDFDTVKRVNNLLEEEEYQKAKLLIKNENKILLNDLSLLYQEYQKFNLTSEYFKLTKERKIFFNKLQNLLANNNLVYICGPKSIGKTTSLLYYLKKKINRYFYINLSYAKKLFESKEKDKLYLSICKELYHCLSFDEVNEVYSYLSNVQYISIMELVYELINYLAKKFTSKDMYIVIDQYKTKLDEKNNYLKKINSLLNNAFNLSIIVCNSLNELDFRQSLEQYLKEPSKFFINYLFIDKLISISEDEMKNLNEKEKEILVNYGNLFQYYYEIIENKNYKKIEEIDNIIKNDMIKEIKGYYNTNNSTEIINKIRNIHDNLNKNIPYEQLLKVIGDFPLKYFYISVNSNNIFIISDIKKESPVQIHFSFPFVIKCINNILYEYKNIEITSVSSNFNAQRKSIEHEENFEEYIWTSRFDFFYKGCKIKNKLKISSIIKIKDDIEKKNYQSCIDMLKDENDSILIIQNESNASYFDSAILKCVNKEKNIYELYLFQVTINKKAEERLCQFLLNTLKYFLKLLFSVKLNIYIQEVYFSYVFKGEEPDGTTINYCEENQINYMNYFETKKCLTMSNINDQIISVFHYLRAPKDMTKSTTILTSYDIDISKISKEVLNDEFNKLDNFLQKKTKNKKEKIKNINDKIENAVKFDKISFRKNNYTDLLLDEELMGNEPIIGISYKIDKRTQKIIQDLKFTNKEISYLFKRIENFGTNLAILKIIQIDNNLVLVPSFRSVILFVNEKNDGNKKNEKYYYDIDKKEAYNLETGIKSHYFDLKSKCYLIIFANSNMISKI